MRIFLVGVAPMLVLGCINDILCAGIPSEAVFLFVSIEAHMTDCFRHDAQHGALGVQHTDGDLSAKRPH